VSNGNYKPNRSFVFGSYSEIKTPILFSRQFVKPFANLLIGAMIERIMPKNGFEKNIEKKEKIQRKVTWDSGNTHNKQSKYSIFWKKKINKIRLKEFLLKKCDIVH
jgi:hypothetical protein